MERVTFNHGVEGSSPSALTKTNQWVAANLRPEKLEFFGLGCRLGCHPTTPPPTQSHHGYNLQVTRSQMLMERLPT